MVLALPKFKLLQTLTDKLNQVARENLTGIRVVRAFNNEAFEERKFAAANDDIYKTNLFVFRVMITLFPVVQLIFNATTLAVIWLGASYIDSGAIEIGNLMAFMQYAMQVIMSFMFLAMAFVMVPRAMVSWRRINQVLQTKLSIKAADQPQKPAAGRRGLVEFREVGFSYPGAEEPVLKDISFVAEPGQTVAFIGSTGSGKSTLVNLIPRFYDVTNGQVLVDGVDVRQLRPRDLVSRIGFVPQKGVLFSGTVKSNVAYGMKTAEPRQIQKAIRVAQAYEFVQKLPKGLDSEITQGGSNVSGGQKQRLAIARAIAKKPEIYVFDDSFSALDFRTDRNLRAALKKETSEATVLVVAQRIGTIKQADKIIVLDNGRIVGQGRHRDLIRQCRVYREIAKSQLSAEEYRSEVEHG
jgi:ATP-binding cassette subfamily B protein